MTGAVEYNADDDQKDNCQSDQNKCIRSIVFLQNVRNVLPFVYCNG